MYEGISRKNLQRAYQLLNLTSMRHVYLRTALLGYGPLDFL